MIRSLLHAWIEGRQAAALASDARSRRRLRLDYLCSRLLRLCSFPGLNQPRQVTLQGLQLHYRFNRGDLQSLREVLVLDTYASVLPFRPSTVLDLGANIGLTSVWLHSRLQGSQTQSGLVKPKQFLAVEAVPANASVAQTNFGANQVPGEVVCAAVGQQTGQAWFLSRRESNLGCLVDRAMPGAVPVPVTNIRELLDRFPGRHVDLVKMDIEGAEAALLGRELDWLDTVQSMVVEWHDDRADPRPLIGNVVAAGFEHQHVNEKRQDNLSLFQRR
ncbi:MAG: FkbM family methyltransferase [Verrucomicrobiaceae bacterium]|nr:FkbM family methyltransferase [Verrucomicrobiaceae bacterium]